MEYGEHNIPIFFVKLKATKIFASRYFQVFLMVHVYSTTDDVKTLTVHRKYLKNFKYVETFGVSSEVFFINDFIYF